jgi:hypothetical protein
MEKGITFVGQDAHKVMIKVAMLLPEETKPAPGEVRFVESADLLQVVQQRLPTRAREDGDAVVLPLAVPHRDLVALEVEVLDPHLEALQQSEPGSVQQLADEQHDAVQVAQDLLDLRARQDDGEALGALGADDALDQADILLQDPLIEKEKGAQCLVLC